MADGRGALRLASMAVGLAACVSVFAAVSTSSGLDAPTVAMGAVAGALLLAVKAMYGIVSALAKVPGAETGEIEASLPSADAELLDEKRRLLRALKELEFDHGMGKLSDGEFAAIGERYRLRAVEVIRRLDRDAPLHPKVAGLLADPEPELAARLCAKCEASNAGDARFCKQCGQELRT
jgi:hypothetical protein